MLLASQPLLPPGYRLVDDRASINARLPDIFMQLMQTYWSLDRTLPIFQMEIDKGHRAVMILRGGEGSEGELAAFCR